MRQSFLPFGGQPGASSSSASEPERQTNLPVPGAKTRGRPPKAKSNPHTQPRLFPAAGPSATSVAEEPAAKRARINGGSGSSQEEGAKAHQHTPFPLRAAPVPVPDSARLWTDLFRPQCAEDVLGNDAQATYLRDWLRALQVVAKRPDVIPKAESSKGKQPEQEAYSIGRTAEEEAWFDQFRKREASAGDGGLALGSTASTAITIDSPSARDIPLSNAIVLTGPSGCGKTAAVYACAAELGFEVFELYPGMGRRAGKDIQNAVGDLGRNHMVSSGGTGGGAFRAAASGSAARPVTSFFQAKAKPDPKVQGASAKQTCQPRQSLILLEEVDVLYADDKGFWPAVIELIGDSRRPIVMTCQDVACVPLQELYVQRVLEFLPPHPFLVAPYLAFLAQERGQKVDEAALQSLYSDTRGRADILTQQRQLHLPSSGPLHPAANLGICSDLRQTILQFQFASQPSSPYPAATSELMPTSQGTAIPADKDSGLRALIATAERRSFADAHLRMPFERAIDLLEPDQYAHGADDLQTSAGTVDLLKPPPDSDAVALPMYGREEELQTALCGQGVLENTLASAAFDGMRISICRLVEQVLEALILPLTSRVPASEAILDYAPLIRNIVAADDAEEGAHEARINAAVMEAQQIDGAGHDASGDDIDIRATNAYQRASASLSKLGIRPSRQTTKMLLQRGSDGLLELTRREADFSRWLLLDRELLNSMRRSALDFSTFS